MYKACKVCNLSFNVIKICFLSTRIAALICIHFCLKHCSFDAFPHVNDSLWPIGLLYKGFHYLDCIAECRVVHFLLASMYRTCDQRSEMRCVSTLHLHCAYTSNRERSRMQVRSLNVCLNVICLCVVFSKKLLQLLSRFKN